MAENKFLNKRQALIAFFLCGIVSAAVGVYLNYPLIFDASNYYTMSQSFVVDGAFSISNYMLSLRGYFYPLLLLGFTTIGHAFGLMPGQAMAFFASFFASLIFTVILPSFFIRKNTWTTFILRILFFGTFMLFWSDLVYYPLSDLWGFGLALMAAYLIRIMLMNEKRMGKRWLLSFLLGCVLYAAYNTRTVYMFSFPLFLAVYLIFALKKKYKFVTVMLSFGLILVGMAVVAWPQIWVNTTHFQTYSPLVNTMVGQDQTLYAGQIKAGLAISRYETMAPMADSGLRGALYFVDDAGEQLTAAFQSAINAGWSGLIRFGLVHIFDLIGIYMRHFINMLYVPFNHVFLTDLGHLNNMFMLLSYTMTFFAGAFVVTTLAKKQERQNAFQTPQTWLLLMMLVVCAAVLPGIVELRFFLPMYSLIYALFWFRCLNPDFLKSAWQKKWRYLSLYIIILFVLISVWSNTFANGDPTDIFMQW